MGKKKKKEALLLYMSKNFYGGPNGRRVKKGRDRVRYHRRRIQRPLGAPPRVVSFFPSLTPNVVLFMGTETFPVLIH